MLAAPSPRVSVIIPAYRAADFIRQALDSVLGQTYRDFEVVLVNDGSPDTHELERRLDPYEDQIRYLRQENRGPAGARNAGLRLARGELVAFLDADDEWLPEFLQSQLRFLEERGRPDLVYADALIIGEGPHVGKTVMQVAPSEGSVTAASLIEGRCTVITSTAVARRRVLEAVGLFDERFRHSQDFDLWLRLALEGRRIEYQRQTLARHRNYPGSHSAGEGTSARGALHVLEMTRRERHLSPRLRRVIGERIEDLRADLALAEGKRQLVAGDFPEARRLIALANLRLKQPKLWFVEQGLRCAPALVRWFYARRNR